MPCAFGDESPGGIDEDRLGNIAACIRANPLHALRRGFLHEGRQPFQAAPALRSAATGLIRTRRGRHRRCRRRLPRGGPPAAAETCRARRTPSSPGSRPSRIGGRRPAGKSGLSGSPGLEPFFDISRWRCASGSIVAQTVSPRVKNWCSRNAKMGKRLDALRRSSEPFSRNRRSTVAQRRRIGAGQARRVLRRHCPRPASCRGACRMRRPVPASARTPKVDSIQEASG